MIRIQIGIDERTIDAAEPNWINQQINRRRSLQEPICVRVKIKIGDVNLMLSTPNCQCFGGDGSPLNSKENQIVELWNRLRLNENDFSGGNLVAFLKQVDKLL